MKGNFYTIMFAAILGTVCAGLLTAAKEFTQPYQDANKQAEEYLNILTALQAHLDENVTAMQLEEIFKSDVTEKQRGDITIFEYSPAEANGKVVAVAVKFAGPGLWGPVKGFLALESDNKTIRGITFYEQEETPGLGGEIVKAWFRDQFIKKTIVDEQGNPGIVIRPGGKSLINGVDGITGATMTCNKVQVMLNDIINKIVGK